MDQPHEGDRPRAQTWQVIVVSRGRSHKPSVLSDAHASETDAKQALVALMEEKLQASDWAPTQAAYKRGVQEAREHGQTVVFSRTYSVRPKPPSTSAV
ncbi:hypothetical protein [Actinomadura litoris]|uniref:hypothetical protein n=1 Tax=Actinomadura litoris TaxID=2678616 RepID=UPI001FA6FF9C|nr:hypothetical protein [Actinomadura litoris]